MTGGVTAFSGGITADGTRIYVGTSDNTRSSHRCRRRSDDDMQIAVGLKNVSGNAVAPNLVTVVP